MSFRSKSKKQSLVDSLSEVFLKPVKKRPSRAKQAAKAGAVGVGVLTIASAVKNYRGGDER
jgi:hypothetical protein